MDGVFSLLCLGTWRGALEDCKADHIFIGSPDTDFHTLACPTDYLFGPSIWDRCRDALRPDNRRFTKSERIAAKKKAERKEAEKRGATSTSVADEEIQVVDEA